MLLSKLVYKCVKNVLYLADTSFTYEFLKSDNFETENRDYKTSLENVFAPINTAIHRLSDRNKIGTKVVSLTEIDKNGFISIPKDISLKTIVNVFSLDKSDYKTYSHRKVGLDKIVVLEPFKEPIFLEYREDIRSFDFDDIKYNVGEQKQIDVELKDYGISDTMTDYIIEFCKGKLMETTDPGMAAYHNNLAEQYFEGLDDQVTNFNQKQVVNKWGM